MAIEELQLATDRLNMRVLVDGPTDGPLVVLLHGFPELADSWRHQLPALADAGYRAVAPDQRGYGGTDRLGPYGASTLADDVASLIRALGRDSATVVGHDWGGGVAWTFAQRHQAMLERLVVANCPPPSVLAAALLRSPRQLRKSWYMFFFQIPLLPEYVLARDHASFVARSLAGGSFVRGTFSDAELQRYRDAFAQPGAATAAINWYRAAMRQSFRSPLTRRSGTSGASRERIDKPILILWGIEDRFLGRELVEPDRLAPLLATGNAAEIVDIEGAGHFVQNEAPQEFNRELIDWLSATAG